MLPYLYNINMYKFCGYISMVFVVLFNFSNIKEKKGMLSNISNLALGKIKNKQQFSIAQIILAMAEFAVFSFIQNGINGLFAGLFSNIFGTNANYFGIAFLNPVVISVVCFFFRIDIYKQLDLITPAYAIALFANKIGCFCDGCCEGFECSFEFFNIKFEHFPVQLIESGSALLIFVFLVFWRKKAKEGTMFPMYLILYSATRFFSEFLREEPNFIWIFKKYHLFCLAGIAIGVIELIVAEKIKDKIVLKNNDFFDLCKDELQNIAVRMGVKRKNNIVHHKNKKKKVAVKTDVSKNARLSKMKMWILVWTLGLVGQVGWSIESTWLNTFVYEKIDKTPSIITPMLIMSALATTVSIFLFGTLTDRTGNRRKLISTGFIFWGVLNGCFALMQYLPKSYLPFTVVCIVVIDMMLSFFASMSTDVGYSTWLTDIMTNENQGQIGGAIAVQVVLGSLLGNIIGGALIGENYNYTRMFIAIGTLLSVFGIVSIVLFDKNDDVKPSAQGSFKQQFSAVFDYKIIFTKKELLWVNITVAIFFIGFNTYFPHLGNYLIHYLGFTPEKMGIVEAIPLVLAMLLTVPVSKFINNNKFIEVSSLSVLSGLVGGAIIFMISPEDIDTNSAFNFTLFSGIFLIGVSYVVMLQATKTWTKNLYPKTGKGQYEGFWAISYAFIPMLFGSNIGEVLVKYSGENIFNELTGRNEYIPDGKIFLIGALISGISIIPIIITKKYVGSKADKAESITTK